MRGLQWVLVPLAVLALAEAWARSTVDRVPVWYEAAEVLAGEGPVDVLFTGSSRAASAIVPAVFDEAVRERTGRRIRSLNLGRGYSTPAQHYLGVRNLLDARPESLRGVTVFWEAAGGLPFPGRNVELWAFPEQPWMLSEVLRFGDLPAFWRSGGLDVDTRLHVTWRLVARPLSLFRRRERARERWLKTVLTPLGTGRPASFEEPVLGQDLSGPAGAGIRGDPEAVQAARDLALTYESRRQTQEPLRDWSRSSLPLLVKRVREGGGRVAFFEVPLSAPFKRVYATPVRQEDARLFTAQAAAWGAPRLVPAFAYDDEDLPDLWHLRPERAPEYSRALAQAWLDALE